MHILVYPLPKNMHQTACESAGQEIRIYQNARAKCAFYSSKTKWCYEKLKTKSSPLMHRAIHQPLHYPGGVLVNRFNTSPVFWGLLDTKWAISMLQKGFFGFLFCGFWFLQFFGGGVKKLYKRLRIFTQKCKGKDKKRKGKKRLCMHISST